MARKLGQHFLKNQAAIKKIVAALDLKPNETIIEIGPGHGALTIPLSEQCQKVGCKIIAIEKDKKLVEILRNTVEINGNIIEIVEGDALKILPNLTSNLSPLTSYKVVGNIPYYITGKLLRLLGDQITIYHLPITRIVLTIQREVAERIVAKKGKINLLAAAVQFWSSPEIIGYLKPTDFDPPPEVESAIIRLTPNLSPSQGDRLGEISGKYYRLIRIIFKQPRKTLVNNLASGLKISKENLEKTLAEAGIAPNARPQNLSVENIMVLVENLV